MGNWVLIFMICEWWKCGKEFTFLARAKPTRHIKKTFTTGKAADTARLTRDTIAALLYP